MLLQMALFHSFLWLIFHYIINILKVAVCIHTRTAISYFNIYLLAALGLCSCTGFSLVVESRTYSLVEVCFRFSLGWLLLLWSMGSRACRLSSCGSQTLEHRLKCHGAQTRDIPGSGIKPTSPALAGGFFIT